MLTWLLLLIVVGGFYALIVPALPILLAFAAGIAYCVLAVSSILSGIVACYIDPIDPNVRRFHEVRSRITPQEFYAFNRVLFAHFLVCGILSQLVTSSSRQTDYSVLYLRLLSS